MAKSRYCNLICVFAVLVALAITVVLLNGEALGIHPMGSDSVQFSTNDLRTDWVTDRATIITLTGDGGTVKGNGAYIHEGNVHIVYAGNYILSGELSNGSVIVDADGDDQIWVQLNGVSLHCEDNAAFWVKNAKKVFLTLAANTENLLTDGEAYGETATDGGVNGALFSRDDLTINGSGSLTVTGSYRHGIVCNDDLVITGGSLTVTAKEDAIHANDSVRMANAALTLDAGDDGITASNDDATDYLYIESGTVTINSCYEGLEANGVTIAGGEITIYPTDDGVNATGSDSSIELSGGSVTVINTDGWDADGLDSNGSIHITGGSLLVSVPSDGSSTALDYGSENGGSLVIDGGTVIAAGSSGMLEAVSAESAQGFAVYAGNGSEAGTQITLKTGSGNVLLSQEIPVAFNALIFSTAELTNGETYTVTVGDEETEVTAGENGSGFGMGRGPHGQRPEQFAEDSGQGFQGMPPEGFSVQGGGRPARPGVAENGETGDRQGMDMALPENSGRRLPAGMTPPDGMELPEGDENAENGQFFPGKHTGGENDRFSQKGERQEKAEVETFTPTPTTWMLVAASVFALAAGLFIALRMRGK